MAQVIILCFLGFLRPPMHEYGLRFLPKMIIIKIQSMRRLAVA